MRPAIQLFTLRDVDEPLPELLARVGETTFQGVEFAGLGESPPEEVRAALDDADLDVAAAHVGIEDLEADLEGTVETYRRFDCDRIVVPWLDESHFTSRDGLTEVARRLAQLDARLAEHGMDLAYHNHDQEFVDLDGITGFELLVDETDIDFELDVGWAHAAGHDPTDLLADLRGRVPLVHLKSVADDDPVELGEGDLDLDACVRAARDAGAEWAIYEHDEPADPYESLEHGAETLEKLLE